MNPSGADVATGGAWWLVLLRGILAILFGLFALLAPASALLALVLVFGAYAVVDGVTAVVAGVRHRRTESHWVWQIVQGIVSIAAGAVAFAWPGVTVLAILYVIAFWAIVMGVSQIVESVAMRRQTSGTWGWMLAGGAVGVLLGLTLLIVPGAGLLTLLWLVGVYSVAVGVLLAVWGIRLRTPGDPVVGEAPGGAAPAV